MLGHLVFGMVENFLTQHFENVEVVLANIDIFGGRVTDILDK
jgi:hypothetical protein